MSETPYPPTRADDSSQTLAGLTLADPYQWLEDGEAPEVRAWQAAQNARTVARLEAWPHAEALRAAVDRHPMPRWGAIPRFAGGHWFRRGRPAGGDMALVQIADAPRGPWRTLFDPSVGAGEHPRNVEWLAPSPDGTIVAFGVSEGGDERNRIQLLDVASGLPLADEIPHVLMDGWVGGVQWLADSSGFYYSALDPDDPAFQTNVGFLHRLGEPAATTPEPLPPEEDYDGWLVVETDRVGRWAVATMALWMTRPLYVRDLAADGPWRPLVAGLTGHWISGVIAGDHYVAVTDHGAERGRLVEIPLDGGGDPSTWRELVPESDAVLRRVQLIGDRLYVVELVDTFSRVRVFERDGRFVREVALPGRGVISQEGWHVLTAHRPAAHPDEYLFAFTTPTESWAVYREDPESGAIEQLEAPEARLEGAVVESRWATSNDGAEVPYHLIRLETTTLDRPRPTLMSGYGGFNMPWHPKYVGAMAAFVEAGGVVCHSNIRGGGELGAHWWSDGRMQRKQQGYDDLFAIAETLIADGVATPETLAIQGTSGGGLLAGVALTQRPELWAVAVPRVAFVDILGACARDPYGRNIVRTEFASDLDDPDEVRRLASFAPCALVREGVRYPAVFLDAGDVDPRCPPWHARKLAAHLQAVAGPEDPPIVLRVWEDVGHAMNNGRETDVRQNSAWLGFVMERLGMVPAGA